jgi:hypothetical protein
MGTTKRKRMEMAKAARRKRGMGVSLRDLLEEIAIGVERLEFEARRRDREARARSRADGGKPTGWTRTLDARGKFLARGAAATEAKQAEMRKANSAAKVADVRTMSDEELARILGREEKS